MKEFNAEEVKNHLIGWIREWFVKNGNNCNAVIGLSGGKDSTVVAALCVEALGKDRVIGVSMPDEGQGLNDADKIAEYFGIRFINAPINEITKVANIYASTDQAIQNIPPRIRMTVLYAISQSNNGRVVGTENASECYLGYFTLHGDEASDVEPIKGLTVTELIAIGDEMNIPYDWVHKRPDDGLPHSTSDEEKFGFSYATLDKYIRGIEEPSAEIKKKIDDWHNSVLFKLRPKAEFSL